MDNYFNGTYYKHQKGDNTLCLIVSQSSSGESIQVITNEFSCTVPNTQANKFTDQGIQLDIKTQEIELRGAISYGSLSPIKYDIMGPLKYLPMQCSHKITSMSHLLLGSVVLSGKNIDFTGGLGYIEGDCGSSFPKKYSWVHCNDFVQQCSITAAVAHIPVLGASFRGCICVVHFEGREIRMATYLGVRAKVSPRAMVLEQGRFKLEINFLSEKRQALEAPQNGKMTRIIMETAAGEATFKLSERGKILFDLYSKNATSELDC